MRRSDPVASGTTPGAEERKALRKLVRGIVLAQGNAFVKELLRSKGKLRVSVPGKNDQIIYQYMSAFIPPRTHQLGKLAVLPPGCTTPALVPSKLTVHAPPRETRPPWSPTNKSSAGRWQRGGPAARAD